MALSNLWTLWQDSSWNSREDSFFLRPLTDRYRRYPHPTLHRRVPGVLITVIRNSLYVVLFYEETLKITDEVIRGLRTKRGLKKEIREKEKRIKRGTGVRTKGKGDTSGIWMVTEGVGDVPPYILVCLVRFGTIVVPKRKGLKTSQLFSVR